MGSTVQTRMDQQSLERLYEETTINLAQAIVGMADRFDPVFKPFNISAVQYNVLRILRGAGAAGLGRNEIRERLINRMSDVTRLLDRMEASGLIRRERDADDRRCVPTFLTDRGRAVLDQIDPIRIEAQRDFLAHLSVEQIETLNGLLKLVHTPLD